MLLDDQLLRSVLASDPEGILVCDTTRDDKPVVYVNRAMERLTGYAADEILGRSPSFLVQHTDAESATGDALQRAFACGDECQLRLESVRRDGTPWACELKCAPIKDAADNVQGVVSYWREIASVPIPNAESDSAFANAMLDPLTGLLRRTYFEERLNREWEVAQYDARTLTLYLFEIDDLPEYESRQGRLEGEQVIRRIARTTRSCFRRAQDVCGRLDYQQIAVQAARAELGSALEYAEVIQGRVRELRIPHAQSNTAGIVTVSIGIATVAPQRTDAPSKLLDAARTCLRQARESGGNRVVGRKV
jgi:diguanylate cyclase (GGDEF)-like protein/PAS domain S-box-containing protein